MKSTKLVCLERTAHHEAGHAVVAFFYQLPFRHVTIEPKEGALGHIRYNVPKWFRPEPDAGDRVLLRAQRHIVVSLAGQLAEGKFMGKRPSSGQHRDNSNAANLAFDIYGSEKAVNAYLSYCWGVAEDVVQFRWSEIQAVAAALLERKTLKRSDVADVIFQAAP